MGLESHGVPVIYCWAGGEGRRKVFYPLLVLQVMKFDSEWGEEARQCYLEMDLWLIGQGFSLMDLYIKVFQMDVYFLLWLCCLLGWWDSFSFGLWNSETHNVVAESSRDENVAYHPNQRRHTCGNNDGWIFFTVIRRSRVGLTDVCLGRIEELWCLVSQRSSLFSLLKSQHREFSYLLSKWDL